MHHMIAEPESDKKLQRKDCFEKSLYEYVLGVFYAND